MKRSHVYFSFCLVGTILPYWQFVPWLSQHGLDIPLFFQQLFANRVSAFFATDVFISAIVVFFFLAFERPRLRGRWWMPPVALLTVGVSLGLPLLLYLRESGRESVTPAGS